MTKNEIREEIKSMKLKIIDLESKLKEPEYIDFGLPSGTLWAPENEEGYFTFDEAVEKFGNSLPARWQFCELIDNCDCVFDSKKKALICKSRLNGNTIEFPALGYRSGDSVAMYDVGRCGNYWSCTPNINYGCGYLYFNRSDYVGLKTNYYNSDGQSVRLCKFKRSSIK